MSLPAAAEPLLEPGYASDSSAVSTSTPRGPSHSTDSASSRLGSGHAEVVTKRSSSATWKRLRSIVASNAKKREEQVDYWRTDITSRKSVHENPLSNITWTGETGEKANYWPKCCRRPGGKVWRSLETFVFLALLGSLTSTVALGYRIACTFVQKNIAALPYLMLNQTTNGTVPAAWSTPASSVLCVLGTTLLCGVCLGATSVLTTQLIAPLAAGSGIPRMKLLFSGVYISKFLSVKTVIVKIFALLCAAASGLSIGSEGPFVHISCGISKVIMRLPFFRSYRFNAVKAHGMLTVGCATGVVAAFGSPFGGVLFAIEVVSTFFRISDMPRMFWASIAGTFTARFIFENGLSLFTADTNPKYVTDYPTYGLIILLGILMGALSGLFILSMKALSSWKMEFLSRKWRCLPSSSKWQTALRGLLLVLAVILVESMCTVIFCSAGTPTLATYNGSTTLFVDELFTFAPNSTYQVENEFVVLVAGTEVQMGTFFAYAVSKLVVTVMAICLPIPAGLFSPVFLLGALFGRLFGSLAQAIVSACGLDPWLVFSFGPADFAIIGAAAFAGGVTRAISTVVIVMELTGELYLQLPVAVCVLAAYFTANRIAPSVYEVIAAISLQPDLPPVDDNIDDHIIADAMCDILPEQVLCARDGVSVVRRWSACHHRRNGFAHVALLFELCRLRCVSCV